MIMIQLHKDKNYSIGNNYHEQLLTGDLAHVEQSLRVLQELKEEIVRQIEKVRAIKFRKEVHLEKRKTYGRTHVEYYVSLHLIPELANLDQLNRATWDSPAYFPSGEMATSHIQIQYPTTERQSFPGKERKAAREYAKKLAEAHGAKLVEE